MEGFSLSRKTPILLRIKETGIASGDIIFRLASR
jgi:hypothetical protein